MIGMLVLTGLTVVTEGLGDAFSIESDIWLCRDSHQRPGKARWCHERSLLSTSHDLLGMEGGKIPSSQNWLVEEEPSVAGAAANAKTFQHFGLLLCGGAIEWCFR